ncbi:MAG: ferrous iron transport protein A [Myxococcales bacterium]|nr:ferrous iron transport protein A [Myxococcales bacterium]
MNERTLAELVPSQGGVIAEVGGDRSFRRRLMELGLVPGTLVTLRQVAPLGDPLEFEVRGCRLSIRRREAAAVILSA